MILHVQQFIQRESGFWKELEELLVEIENNHQGAIPLNRLRRFHYLSERTANDLGQIQHLINQDELKQHLESLVSRAFEQIQSDQRNPLRFHPIHWFFVQFPQTFRRHIKAFILSTAITVLGMSFGGASLLIHPESKAVLLPFSHLSGSPSERVAEEEQINIGSRHKTTFSASLMTHNIKVSIFVLALGLTWGLGTFVLLFYNGVILGVVIADYLLAGEGVFLTGWLLPHGSFEIPAILIAGQAGFLLANALAGWKTRTLIQKRLRQILPDLMTLIGGFSIMLIWAGIVEAFLSQDHQPVISYALKISIGIVELFLLISFLSLSGRKKKEVAH